MENHLCDICVPFTSNRSRWKSLSPAEGATLDRDSIAYDEELRRSGHYIVSDALQRATTAKTLRVRNGKLSVMDGPFAETKEQLGGFILVEARNMDEAVELASKIPMAQTRHHRGPPDHGNVVKIQILKA